MTALVAPDYVRTMAAYNAEMNRRLYETAGRLTDSARRQDRGAFWDSIHGTLNHILWGDRMWMSRFDGWDKPPVVQKDSAGMIGDYAELWRARQDADKGIRDWAAKVDSAWLNGDLVWLSGTTGTEMRMPAGFLVMHFFNHQTHHRGQAHAMITAAGEDTSDTDLFLVLPGG